MKRILTIALIFVLGSCDNARTVSYQEEQLQEVYKVPSKHVVLLTANNFLVKRDSTLLHVRISAEKASMDIYFEREITFE